MKKVIISLMMACACMFSCTKTNDKQQAGQWFSNKVVPMYNDTKEANYCFFVQVGHRRSECGGKCIELWGIPTHADCQGAGHYCSKATSVTLQQTGSTITATTTDTFGLTSEDFFLMPDRSLYYYTDEDNNRVYLNIPEQLVFRDSTTRQFTFTGLFFTNVPEYSND